MRIFSIRGSTKGIPPLEWRFLWLSGIGSPLLALAATALGGWRNGLVLLLLAVLVSADFLWIARGLRGVATPGNEVRPGTSFRAAAALLGRALLLILGLYAILKVLPGEGGAAAAGIGSPLVFLTIASLTGRRG